MVQVGDRKTCELGTNSVPYCGIEIELRPVENPSLPPGWFEVVSGRPHTCRWVCRSCHLKVGGGDRHALDCDRRFQRT
jgi:hypothetical protein